MSRRVLPLLTAVAAVVVMPGLASASSDEASFTEPCLVPFDEGADLDILKGLIKESIDVEDDVFVHDMPAVRVLWLELSPEDCLELQDSPIEGITGAVIAPAVNAPTDPFNTLNPAWPFNPSPDGMDGASYGGIQVIPTDYARVAAEPGDYSDVDVAVIDTGVSEHDDLNLVGGFDCTDPQNGDQNWWHDGYGHGSHVAGIIGALDNDRGTVGIAPGARIWSFKVLGDDGSGSFASVLCGVDQVAQQAGTIEVANLSLGGQIPATPLWAGDPIHDGFGITADLGVHIVVSAGNDGIDAINSSPANYTESVITVSALTDYDGLPGGLSAPNGNIPPDYIDDHKALFSNFGSAVDFIAPGVDVLSTLPANTYGRASGTSMAAPVVSGVFAAHIAECGQASREEAFERIHVWSSQAGWSVRSAWDGDVGQDHEPLVRFGAPCDLELEEVEE